MGDVHVVGGGRQILKLLAGEDIGSDKVNLGVTVLASLGGGHVDDLARATLNDDVTVLAQSGTLHREGGRGTGISRLEGDVKLYNHVSCEHENAFVRRCFRAGLYRGGRGAPLKRGERASRCGARTHSERVAWEVAGLEARGEKRCVGNSVPLQRTW